MEYEPTVDCNEATLPGQQQASTLPIDWPYTSRHSLLVESPAKLSTLLFASSAVWFPGMPIFYLYTGL